MIAALAILPGDAGPAQAFTFNCTWKVTGYRPVPKSGIIDAN
jgi:hypothetical protein